MQYICSIVEPAGLISVGLLHRKFDLLTWVVQAGIREKAQLLEFTTVAIRSLPEFTLLLLMVELHRRGLCLKPRIDWNGVNCRSKSVDLSCI